MFHLMLKTTTEALSHRTVATDIFTFKKIGNSRRMLIVDNTKSLGLRWCNLLAVIIEVTPTPSIFPSHCGARTHFADSSVVVQST